MATTVMRLLFLSAKYTTLHDIAQAYTLTSPFCRLNSTQEVA
jgi:hypothetical protein